MAEMLMRKGDYGAVEQLCWKTLGDMGKVPGAEHPVTDISLDNLADFLRGQGDEDLAEPIYRKALEIWEKMLRAEHPDTAADLDNLVDLFISKAGYDDAQPLYFETLGILEKALGADHPYVATYLNNLAELLASKGDYSSAEPMLRKALGIREKVLGAEHPDTAQCLLNLALLFRDKKDYGTATTLFKRLIATFEDQTVSDRSILNSIAVSYNELAFHIYSPRKNWKAANHHYRQAIGFFIRSSNPLEATNAELNLMVMLRSSGQEVGLDRIRELTRKMEEAGDKRAVKGQRLLQELS
jgi:tetratricopeptide (TPR) repeat protein